MAAGAVVGAVARQIAAQSAAKVAAAKAAAKAAASKSAGASFKTVLAKTTVKSHYRAGIFVPAHTKVIAKKIALRR